MKYKNYGFWTSLSASVVVLLTAVGKHFGFEISSEIVTDIIMGVAGVLVVFGIVKMPKPNKALKNQTGDKTEQVSTEISQDTFKTETIESPIKQGEQDDKAEPVENLDDNNRL